MADPIWPTYPWHLLLISWTEPSTGFLIEHTHRLVDYILGICVIVLAASLWFLDHRSWMRRLGLLALAGVIAQGLLGGFRVKLNELVGTDLAFAHGCFAQLIFGLLAAIAVCTGPSWQALCQVSGTRGLQPVRRLAMATTCLIYLQLVLGGVVRHTSASFGPRAHLILAFAVVAAAAWLAKTIVDHPQVVCVLKASALLLLVLIGLQVGLGVEAWIGKFARGMVVELDPLTIQKGVIRTAHFLAGSAIFATGIVITLKAYALGSLADGPVRLPAPTPEGGIA
jgi:cytochrome c oxidase assembly protein subunit 15